MAIPATTRLRTLTAKDPSAFESFLNRIGIRVEIKAIQFDGKKWWLFFIPPDDIAIDVKSTDLK